MLTWRASSTVAEGRDHKEEKQKEVCSVRAGGGEAFLHQPAERLPPWPGAQLRLAPRSPRPCSSRPARPGPPGHLVLARLVKLFTTCHPVS